MNGRATEERIKRSTTLYDFGFGPVFYFVFFAGAIVIGIIIDYLWNWLVLTVALWRPLRSTDPTAEITIPRVTIGRRMLYCIPVTVIGIPINAAYYFIVWNWDDTPRFDIPLQVLLITVPIGLLWLMNYLLSKYYLKLDNRQAVTVAVIMAFFTAPWLMLIIPHL
jgi:hypothetical protein